MSGAPLLPLELGELGTRAVPGSPSRRVSGVEGCSVGTERWRKVLDIAKGQGKSLGTNTLNFYHWGLGWRCYKTRMETPGAGLSEHLWLKVTIILNIKGNTQMGEQKKKNQQAWQKNENFSYCPVCGLWPSKGYTVLCVYVQPTLLEFIKVLAA